MSDTPLDVQGIAETLGPAKRSPPQSLMLPRSGENAEMLAALKQTRDYDRDRRLGDIASRFTGWVAAALMAVPLVYSLNIIANRPVPQDRIWLATQRADGSSDPAKPIEDQTPSERENTINAFMFAYVDYRESYDAEHVKRNYARTTFTTVGEPQKQYIKFMNDIPNRWTETLAKVGERRVGDETVTRSGDDAFEVEYTVKVKDQQGIWLPEETCRARISYAISKDMPTEVARRIDPLKLVVTRYTNHPAAFAPKATACSVFPLS